MNFDVRQKMIDDCVNWTAILHDMLPLQIDRTEFTAMDDDMLEQEWNWLYDMVYLK